MTPRWLLRLLNWRKIQRTNDELNLAYRTACNYHRAGESRLADAWDRRCRLLLDHRRDLGVD